MKYFSFCQNDDSIREALQGLIDIPFNSDIFNFILLFTYKELLELLRTPNFCSNYIGYYGYFDTSKV